MSAEKGKPFTLLDYSENLGAAEAGDAKAQNVVAGCLLQGIGVEKNATEAYRWYSLSAEQGFVIAFYNKSLCLLNGVGCKQDEPEGRRLLAKAAAQGDADAQYIYAIVLTSGRGGPVDNVEARRQARSAAEKEHADAQSLLGTLLLEGKGGDTDSAEALTWYRRAAEVGSADANYRLACLYDAGEHVPKNSAEALRWFEKAAALNHVGALGMLGVMYETGQNVPVDLTKAFGYYVRGKQSDFPILQMRLGACYYLGRGTEKNMPLAHEHYKKAHALGVPGAWEMMWRTRNLGLKEIAMVAGPILAFGVLAVQIPNYFSSDFQKLAGVTFYLALWPVMVAAMIGFRSASVGRALKFGLAEWCVAVAAAIPGIGLADKLASDWLIRDRQDLRFSMTIWTAVLMAVLQFTGSAYVLFAFQNRKPALAAGKLRWVAILAGSLFGVAAVTIALLMIRSQ